MKREDTIAMYREDFLKGKTEAQCKKFDEKDINKQYGSIMAWKRREGLSKSRPRKAPMSSASILDELKRVKKNIPALDLSEKDIEKTLAILASIQEDLKNFEDTKKAQRLRDLKSKRSSLDREIQELEQTVVK